MRRRAALATGDRTAMTWRMLAAAQWREQPLRVLITVLAIALGVALGSAVYLVTTAALSEFNQATRRLVGEADLVIRGPPQGFNEGQFVTLSRDPAVGVASPMLELALSLPGTRTQLKVLGLDPLLAASVQPVLMAALGGDITALFHPDAIVLSRAAAESLHLNRGDALTVVVGSGKRSLRVIDVLPDTVYPEPLGIMDIASAQWTLGRLGQLNRIDLRLRQGMDARIVRTRLGASLPPGLVVLTPAIERGRATTATRAYRANLDMLALVALLTGAFLVFSTQSLAVLRRRTVFGLLRALGVTRGELQRALLGEGVVIGIMGSLLGVLLGALVAALALRYLGTDLGNRQYVTSGVRLALPAGPMLVFFAVGVVVAGMGAWIPAREAARRAPALALKAGDAEPALSALSTTLPALALILTGSLMAWLPPVGRVPLPGYLAIAELLTGSVLLVPALMRFATRLAPRTGRVEIDTAVAQLQGSAGLAAVSLASIIVSFSLMVAMAIMVNSFRNSFELWLVKLLPADLQLRVDNGGGSGALSAEDQARIAALPGVARVDFRRAQSFWLRPDHPPVTLIARQLSVDDVENALPLVHKARQPMPAGDQPAWISEAVQDLFDYRPGERISVPLAGRAYSFVIAGVWRDYAHPGGAVVIPRSAYIAATGDRGATEASVWRRPQWDATALEHAIGAVLPAHSAVEMMSTPQLRQRSLQLFDRAFAITYALEVVAVLIGLVGVSVAANSTVLARRAQFGMLRHIGMLRWQVQAMLASEGVLMSVLAVLYGLLLGAVLSLILVYVINRQSFNWSIDLSVPWSDLGLLGLMLIGASALTALWSGRAALSVDAIRAVKEDW